MRQIRVLLVDTNDILLEAVSEWLVSDSAVTVVGTAHGGSEALRRIAELRPDLVVINAALHEGMSGFEVTRRIKTDPQAPVVALLTLHDSRAARAEAADAGADQLVAGTDVVGQLMPTVRRLHELVADATDETKTRPGAAKSATDTQINPTRLPDSPSGE